MMMTQDAAAGKRSLSFLARIGNFSLYVSTLNIKALSCCAATTARLVIILMTRNMSILFRDNYRGYNVA